MIDSDVTSQPYILFGSSFPKDKEYTQVQLHAWHNFLKATLPCSFSSARKLSIEYLSFINTVNPGLNCFTYAQFYW